MKTIAVKESLCPECGLPKRYSTSLEGYVPKPGDLVICEDCFTVCQYGNELNLLPFDTSRLPPETLEEIQHTIATVKKAQARTRAR